MAKKAEAGSTKKAEKKPKTFYMLKRQDGDKLIILKGYGEIPKQWK